MPTFWVDPLGANRRWWRGNRREGKGWLKNQRFFVRTSREGSHISPTVWHGTFESMIFKFSYGGIYTQLVRFYKFLIHGDIKNQRMP